MSMSSRAKSATNAPGVHHGGERQLLETATAQREIFGGTARVMPVSGADVGEMTPDERAELGDREERRKRARTTLGELHECDAEMARAPRTEGGDPHPRSGLARSMFRSITATSDNDAAQLSIRTAEAVDAAVASFPSGDNSKTYDMMQRLMARLTETYAAMARGELSSPDDITRLVREARHDGELPPELRFAAPTVVFTPLALQNALMVHNAAISAPRCARGTQCAYNVPRQIIGPATGMNGTLTAFVHPGTEPTGIETCLLCMLQAAEIDVDGANAANMQTLIPPISVAFRGFPASMLLPEVYKTRDGTPYHVPRFSVIMNNLGAETRTIFDERRRCNVRVTGLLLGLPDMYLEEHYIARGLGRVGTAPGQPFSVALQCHGTNYLGLPPVRALFVRAPLRHGEVQTLRVESERVLAAQLRAAEPELYFADYDAVFAPFDETVARVRSGALHALCAGMVRHSRSVLAALGMRELPPIEAADEWALWLRLCSAHMFDGVLATRHAEMVAEDGACERLRAATRDLGELRLSLQLFIDAHIPLFLLVRDGVDDAARRACARPRRELAFGADDFMAMAHMLPQARIWSRAVGPTNPEVEALLNVAIGKATAQRCKKRASARATFTQTRSRPYLRGVVLDIWYLGLMGNYPRVVRRPGWALRVAIYQAVHTQARGGDAAFARLFSRGSAAHLDRTSVASAHFSRMLYDHQIYRTTGFYAVMAYYYGHELRWNIIRDAVTEYTEAIERDFARDGDLGCAMVHIHRVVNETSGKHWAFLTRVPEDTFQGTICSLIAQYFNVLACVTQVPNGPAIQLARMRRAIEFLNTPGPNGRKATRADWPEPLKLFYRLFPDGIPPEFDDGRVHNYIWTPGTPHPLISDADIALLTAMAPGAFDPATGMIDVACLLLVGVPENEIRLIYATFVHLAIKNVAKSWMTPYMTKIGSIRTMCVLYEFMRAVERHTAIHRVPLPAHVAAEQMQALRRTYQVPRGMALPAGTGDIVVCSQCLTLLTAVFDPGAKKPLDAAGAVHSRTAVQLDPTDGELFCFACTDQAKGRPIPRPWTLPGVGSIWHVKDTAYALCEHGVPAVYDGMRSDGFRIECGCARPRMASNTYAPSEAMYVTETVALHAVARAALVPPGARAAAACDVCGAAIAEGAAQNAGAVKVRRYGAIVEDHLCGACFTTASRRELVGGYVPRHVDLLKAMS